MKLIVTDLDGTLLNNNETYDTEIFNNVYSKMKEKNIEFAICTGKQCERVEELFTNSNLKIWVMGDSATRITRQKKLVKEFPMNQSIALKMVESMKEFDSDLIIIACTNDGAFIRENIKDEYFKIIRGSYANLKKVHPTQEVTGNLLEITVYDTSKRATRLAHHLKSFKEQLYIVASEPAWLDVTEFNINKRKTVEELQKLLGVTKEDTMSFGDGENDVELMNAAKYSFAMRNASGNTKKAAHFITKSNEEDGVLTTIEKIMDLI